MIKNLYRTNHKALPGARRRVAAAEAGARRGGGPVWVPMLPLKNLKIVKIVKTLWTLWIL